MTYVSQKTFISAFAIIFGISRNMEVLQLSVTMKLGVAMWFVLTKDTHQLKWPGSLLGGHFKNQHMICYLPSPSATLTGTAI